MPTPKVNETRLESAWQVTLRHALQVSTVLPRARTGLDANLPRRGFHATPIHAAICRLLQRAEKKCQIRIRIESLQVTGEQFLR